MSGIINIPTMTSLLHDTDVFIGSNNLLTNGDDAHIHKRIIDDVFEFAEIGKPFTSALINMFLEMEVGNEIHLPLFEPDPAGESADDVLFRLYKITRDINKFKFELLNLTPEAYALMENVETEIDTEFQDSLGSVPPFVVARVIDMLNHMMTKLCNSNFMGSTGGTSRKRRKPKTKSKRKHTRKSKH